MAPGEERGTGMGVKLFVGGLSFTTTNESLRQAFARHGTVQSAMVMTDRETQRSRGFGFVEMATPEEAETAINALNGTVLDGRTIRVDRATPRGTPPPPRPPRPAGAPRPAFGPGPRPWSPGPPGGARFAPPPPPAESGGRRDRKRGEGEGDRRPGKKRGGRPATERRAQDKGRRSEDWW
ncbi:MAG TPA: RNA-binding protein [Calidithermus sp.]|jgi:RNA recognition motif-containing protein|nr:RNA-binding protein [Calidithermus sp.]